MKDAWLNGEMTPAHCIFAATVIRECVEKEWSLQLQDSSTPVLSIDAPALHLPCNFSSACRNCLKCRWTYPEACVVGGAWGRRVAIRTDEIQLKKCPDDGGGGLANGTGPASPSLRTGMNAPGPQADRAGQRAPVKGISNAPSSPHQPAELPTLVTLGHK